MATLDKPTRPLDLGESNRRIRHPLQRLRSTIRLYVALECTALVLLFLAAWFWVGLVFDYGVFRLTSLSFLKMPPLDWVDVFPAVYYGLLVVLGILTAGLIAYMAGMRLMREFSDPALALLLERRFPRLLGDRLITAVELHDVKQAAKYGYSPAMIEQTIHDAAERVDRVPVAEVFNWRRLVYQGVFVLVAALGVYLVVGGVCCIVAAANSEPALSGFTDLNDVAQTWTKRNLLLQKSYWPRHAYLVLVQPESGEVRVGRDKAQTELKVRAVKWIVADDRDAPRGRYGWRPLDWKDVTPELLGTDRVPSLPARWSSWTIDDIDSKLANMDLDRLLAVKQVMTRIDGLTKDPRITRRRTDEGRNALFIQDAPPAVQGAGYVGLGLQGSVLPLLGYTGAGLQAGEWRPLLWTDVKRLGPKYLDTDVPELPNEFSNEWDVDQMDQELTAMEVEKLPALKAELFDRLEAQAARHDMRRRLRKLDVPENVQVLYWNRKAKINTDQKLQKRGNEYAVTLNELHDSVSFTVRASDYYTPDGTITIVPPPAFKNFTCDEYKPAYIFYRLDGQEDALAKAAKLRLPLGGLLTCPIAAGPLAVIPWAAAKPLSPLAYRRQVFPDIPLQTISGEVTKVPPVPAGSHVVLKGLMDRPLAGPPRMMKPSTPSKDSSFPSLWEIQWSSDKADEFTIRIDDVRAKLEFAFEMVDKDNVTSRRDVQIDALSDLVPEVEVQLADYVRTIKEDFDFKELKLDPKAYRDLKVMTVGAWLPLVGKIKDDHGLTEVNLVYSVTPLENRAPGGKGDPLLGPANLLTGGYALAQFAAQYRVVTPQGGAQRQALRHFVEALAKRPGVRVQAADLEGWVSRKQDLENYEQRWKGRDPVSVLDLYEIEPDAANTSSPKTGLDLEPLNLKEPPDSKRVQPKYLLTLEVEALDTDVEAQPPHRGVTKTRFSILLVSDAELLSLIAREEEKLHLDLKKVVDDLEENEQRIGHTVTDLTLRRVPGSEDDRKKFYQELSSARTHMGGVLTALDDEQAAATKVFQSFERILNEMHASRIQQQWIGRVQQNIVTPLKGIVEVDYKKTKEQVEELHKALNDPDQDPQKALEKSKALASAARDEVKQLHDKLKKVLDSMEQLTDLNREIKRLQAILEKTENQGSIFEKTKVDLESILIDKAFKDFDK